MNPSSSACPPGLHGLLCQLQCNCMNGASCHPVSGQCICPPGYHGVRCHRGQSNHCQPHKITGFLPLHFVWLRFCDRLSACVQGTYGFGCAKACDCEDDASCDPVTGRCLCSSGKAGPRCDIGNLLHSHKHTHTDGKEQRELVVINTLFRCLCALFKRDLHVWEIFSNNIMFVLTWVCTAG